MKIHTPEIIHPLASSKQFWTCHFPRPPPHQRSREECALTPAAAPGWAKKNGTWPFNPQPRFREQGLRAAASRLLLRMLNSIDRAKLGPCRMAEPSPVSSAAAPSPPPPLAQTRKGEAAAPESACIRSIKFLRQNASARITFAVPAAASEPSRFGAGAC